MRISDWSSDVCSSDLSIVFRSPHAWYTPATIVFGLVLGGTAALLAVQVLRGLNLPRWMAWLVAAVFFVALLSNAVGGLDKIRSEEHTSELQALMRISYAVVCLKKKTTIT